ncbi:DUF378 domain-containing protein [Latilactobacillus fragifolii]|uniref:DUF378 domain-containing protein n=1 Tax=Latilactobacillus fragifolii TaxID=2814244 RepID=UPI001ABBD17D|nr:DUF378 domain-containing protein [Latilactobacillus fragifolii]
MKTLDNIALTLLIVGGLNWLLVGLFKFDLVAMLFGGQAAIISRIVYVLVGLSAIYCIKLFAIVNTTPHQ